jgi:hypothetical protein
MTQQHSHRSRFLNATRSSDRTEVSIAFSAPVVVRRRIGWAEDPAFFAAAGRVADAVGVLRRPETGEALR